MSVRRPKLQRCGLAALIFACVLSVSVFWLSMPASWGVPNNAPMSEGSVDNSPVTLKYFGLHIGPNAPWPTVPFGAMRDHIAWKLVEPEKGHFEYGRQDWYVQQAVDHNVDLILTLGFVPRWASSTPDTKCRVGLGQCGEPRDINEWRNFVRTVAAHYKGRVHYYEVWNEPNDTLYYGGSIQGMVRMTQTASEVLKQVDPSIQLISGPPVGPEGVKWLDRFLQAGGGKYADIIGFHFYVAPGPPEGIYRLAEQVQGMMSHYGVADKPLWNTEIGWMGVSLTEYWQAAYVARTLLLLRSAGVARCLWYAWGMNPGDLTLLLAKQDRTTPTEAGQAFGVMEKWMIGGTVSSCTSQHIPEAFKSAHGLWTCEIHRNGVVNRVVWNSGGETQFTVPANWAIKRLGDLKGEYKPMPGQGQIKVGEQPILLSAE